MLEPEAIVTAQPIAKVRPHARVKPGARVGPDARVRVEAKNKAQVRVRVRFREVCRVDKYNSDLTKKLIQARLLLLYEDNFLIP